MMSILLARGTGAGKTTRQQPNLPHVEHCSDTAAERQFLVTEVAAPIVTIRQQYLMGLLRCSINSI